MTVAELLGRARTVALRRRPDDTAPLPAVSSGDSGARHRRPEAAGEDVRSGSRTRLVLGGAGMLAAVAVAGGVVLGQGGGDRPSGNITDGAVAPRQPATPVVTIEGVARTAETPTTTVVPEVSEQATAVTGSDSAEPTVRSEPAPNSQDRREQTREAVESRLEEWESRLNEMPGIPRW